MPDIDDGRFMTSYELYIRHGDRKMRLVEKTTGKPVAIEAIRVPGRYKDGIFIRPRDATGVYLMSDEIHIVDELPKVVIRAAR